MAHSLGRSSSSEPPPRFIAEFIIVLVSTIVKSRSEDRSKVDHRKLTRGQRLEDRCVEESEMIKEMQRNGSHLLDGYGCPQITEKKADCVTGWSVG